MEAQMNESVRKIVRRIMTMCVFGALLLVYAACAEIGAGQDRFEVLLQRTAKQVSSFLDVLSETNCTERVLQEKLADNGKVVEKEASTYDYLIILSTDGGELSLSESRIAPQNAKRKKLTSPLLISNGFSTLFLIFHPYYSAGFQFADEGEESFEGRTFAKIHFQHIPGTRSPAALAVRGREYPLDLTGTAWVDVATGVIGKLTANIDSGMEDVGLHMLHSEMRFAPVTFHDSPESFWLPAQVTVEVETRHQHWRNTHRFSDYKRFSVNTKEQMAKQ
jgi:hypothetical protein